MALVASTKPTSPIPKDRGYRVGVQGKKEVTGQSAVPKFADCPGRRTRATAVQTAACSPPVSDMQQNAHSSLSKAASAQARHHMQGELTELAGCFSCCHMPVSLSVY